MIEARTRHLASAALALAAALLPSVAASSSVYSVGGLGEPTLEEGADLRALGGAGAGAYGPDRFSLVNPASTAGVTHLLLQGTIVPTYRRVSAASLSSETATETEVPSLRGLVRLPGRIVLGAAYAVGTNASFRVDRDENAGTPSTLRIDGSGGMQLIRITASRAIAPSFRVGFDHEIIAGHYREEWTRDFADTLLATSRDTLEARYQRLGRWRLGAQVSHKGWTLGGVLETPRRLPLTTFQRASGTTVETSGQSLHMPGGFVLGVSGPVVARWHVAAQYRRADWKRSSLQSDLVDFRALERISVGVERAGSDAEGGTWRSRLPLRLGVSYLRWPDLLPLAGQTDITGGTAGVNEWTLSVGSGFLTQDKIGAIDLSLEAGKRGNRDALGVDERYLRVAVTLKIRDDTWK